MINKLRNKIIIVIMVILTFTVIIVMAAINVISGMSNQMEIDNRLRSIASSDGMISGRSYDFDPYNSYGPAGYVDYFSIKIDRTFQVKSIVISRDIEIDEDTILEYVNKVFLPYESSGELGSYAYYTTTMPYGYITVFMDVETYQSTARNLLLTTQLIGAAALMLFLGMTLILSRWLVKPVKETFDKQKLFISNASHELKTPLAVINANTEVLENEIGENKWVGYIRSETERMNELVNELLCLARLEDKSGHPMVFEECDLSALVLQTVLPFESTVFELGKKLETDIAPDVHLKCDKSSVRHILTILIDNAIKYSFDNGEIRVKLYTHSGKKIIEVYNTGEGVSRDKLDKIFERFYREDEVRNGKNGGYGLGLAIAKASAEANHGKITAKSEKGKWMKFIVTF